MLRVRQKLYGTLLGEGLGVVVLKRLADARRDGDRVYSIVKSVGQSSDGRALGLLAPRLEGEVLAVQRAYAQAGIEPGSVSLIEAHGTGIPLGDKTEISAIGQVMGERVGDVPVCAIGSVKSMISHCIPAAGVAGLIKTSLALHYKVLPPTLCNEPNPDLGIEKTPLYINTEARPWIHNVDNPRRAGVNAFGFGGINTHAILEEVSPEPDADKGFGDWSSELMLVSAPDRPDLLAQLDRIHTYISNRGDSPITVHDVAYTVNQEQRDGSQRLAIVATDLDDLANKVSKVRKALADEDRHLYQARSGVLFSDRPLTGKLAFLFPGEGAQYPGMLADLAIAFPVVRQWFDFWESIYSDERDFPSTSTVFPPPTSMADDARARIEKKLFELEIGSESMFISTQAMFALLNEFGVTADVMLGHSSGENSALVAAGMVRLGDRDKMRAHILRLNEMYREIDAAGAVTTGSLLTVGAVHRDIVLEVVSQSDDGLYLALDNCRHQAVLYGPGEAIDKAVERFRKEGGLCAYLPFNRAYHTPLFSKVSETIETFFESVEFGEANLPVYSCVNAGLYPEGEAKIRHHAAIQWSSCVRFMETVEKMYQDGARIFVEVGPSGNLTSFVKDILNDQDHVAISSNSRTRTGLFQLQQLLATLFINAREFDSDRLFRDRQARFLNLDEAAPEPARPAPLLSNTLPIVELDTEELAQVSAIVNSHAQPFVQQIPPSAGGEPAQQVSQAAQYAVPTDPVTQHFGAMQDFLEQQRRLLQAGYAGLVQQPVQNLDWPFIQRLTEHTSDRAVAEFDLNVSTQRFILEHILYSRDVSDLDPDLHALPVVPLTVSLEMLAEIGALLSTRAYFTGLENIRAYNWIALDEGVKTITLVAERVAIDTHSDRCHAVIYDGATPLLEGDVLFSDLAPEPAPLLPALTNPQAPIWQDHELYTTGMFHGPMYHSVRHLIAWDATGIDAELNPTPVDGFFDDFSRPNFFLNPVLLDAVGHMTAFWIAQSRGTDFSCFPSQIDKIELIAPNVEATDGFTLRGRVGFIEQQGRSDRYLEGNYDCLDGNGQAVFRISGWRDRFFDVPHSFYYGRTNPREGWYGHDLTSIYPALPAGVRVWQVPAFPDGFLDDAGAVWKRLLAFTLLSREEREFWNSMAANPRRRSEWIMGRIALKEAARSWIADHYGVLLYPADIVIRTDAAGKPYVAREGLESFGPPPQVSLSHAAGNSVAAAGPAHASLGVDLELFGRVKVAEFAQGAFTDGERQHVERAPASQQEEVALRMWCAKEAAAKSLGIGLNGRPSLLQVKEFDANGQTAVVTGEGAEIPVVIQRCDESIIAVANR
jgi:acyl transferase domain-containing protein/phosphopantetheinyl transferase